MTLQIVQRQLITITYGFDLFGITGQLHGTFIGEGTICTLKHGCPALINSLTQLGAVMSSHSHFVPVMPHCHAVSMVEKALETLRHSYRRWRGGVERHYLNIEDIPLAWTRLCATVNPRVNDSVTLVD
ncbi:Uncharacterised protein [Escherichia coli]|nr:Uncharacterised protein [Escherichia coli]